ncbi:MAG: 23S rRNA (guanosine(2251)-2'-O)-methyltransferase RlmB [Flavobacteriaceae bacterium]|jgi:23S rRNA (guanosine2251-2'-O)-methyltransferase|nr:23S rRNA (guanosine(2251)-2'-O)-methyltransferase RlmB [Flavobacteriaceae bacterium]MBT5282586.1 23S rRNA (guanosine(2251)-2'-O)-methyltransferase RlmB [Flavobacteriaceae bacterium]MDG1885409.1 23S rRNA (guanosine(2251)-2'-O)-methyltransferase RlmB [Flavobacteriaceae bacterium]MDG1926858.1 23S rRNA (guanosine(2251)-2'-O)-methyltransferase RlmB [Flavobacteriaceae bacterium]
MEETVTIFGIRAILEAIESGKSLDRVWLLKGTQSKLFEQLLHVLRNENIAFSFVPVERLDRFSSKNHQGAVARIGALSTQDMEPLIESVLKEKENPVFVLLDGVTDTRNFGAILRSAAATGVDAVFISSTGSAPLNGDVVKTSAGGAFKVPISKVQHLKDVVYYLKAHDIPTLGITEKSTETLYDSDLKGPLALVFGAEDVGISNGLLKILDHKAKLPMTEAVDSLNVSVACAVVFYETIRQRR